MFFTYDPTAGPKAAEFKPVVGTTKIFQFSAAPSLTLRRVNTFQEAVACGGVLLLNQATGRWVMLAGKVLTKTLVKGGERRLAHVLVHDLRVQLRQSHTKNIDVGFSSYRPPIGATCTMDAGATTIEFLGDPATITVLVLGVLTQGHGSGAGLLGEANAGPRGSDVFGPIVRHTMQATRYNEANYPNVTTTHNLGNGANYGNFPAWAPNSGHTWVARMRPNSWYLNTEADLGLARTYMTVNKTKILDQWAPSMDPDVFAYYVSTYDETVATTFSATDRLLAHVPFFGGSNVLNSFSDGDFRVVTSVPMVDMGSYSATGTNSVGPDQAASRTAREIRYQNHIVLPFMDPDADAACLANFDPASFTASVQSAPRTLRFGTAADVEVRDLVGSLSPRLGLMTPADSGVILVEDIAADYVPLTVPKGDNVYSITDPSAASLEFDSAVSKYRNSLTLGRSMYLGQFMRHMWRFSAAWDQAAQEAAKADE